MCLIESFKICQKTNKIVSHDSRRAAQDSFCLKHPFPGSLSRHRVTHHAFI